MKKLITNAVAAGLLFAVCFAAFKTLGQFAVYAILAITILVFAGGGLPKVDPWRHAQAGNLAVPNWFDTNTLIAIIPNLKKAQKFLLNTFFGNTITSDTEFVSIDIDIGVRRMTPFVSPLLEGKMVEQRRMATNTYKPPYLKDKRALDLRKPVRRMIGERIGGSMNGQEREMANLNFEMEDQVDMVDRRLEWMAASALINGSVRVDGDGFDSVVIDFGRHASLTIALTGTAKWTVANVVAGNATPATNIEDWQRRILKRSGATVRDVIMTTTPYAGFLADPLVKGAVFYPALGQSGNVLNPGAQIEKGAILKGYWGQYRIWMYNDWYVDQNGVERPMIPDGYVLMAGTELMNGITAYGVILDPEFNYQSLAYAPKTWTKKDPGQRLLMMQSSPIVFPGRPDATLSAKVADPVYS